jgi:hypothetical protein
MSDHAARFWIRSRTPVVWRAECGDHVSFQGETYEEVEDKWREHVHEQTGRAPTPRGSTDVPRWTP